MLVTSTSATLICDKPAQFAALANTEETPTPPPPPVSNVARRRQLIKQTTPQRHNPICPCESCPKSSHASKGTPKETTKVPLATGAHEMTGAWEALNSSMTKLERSGAQWCVPADESATTKPQPAPGRMGHSSVGGTLSNQPPTAVQISQGEDCAIPGEELDVLMKAFEKFQLTNDKDDPVCILEEEAMPEQLLAGVNEAEKVRVTVAMDSGAVRNVLHPDDLLWVARGVGGLRPADLLWILGQ